MKLLAAALLSVFATSASAEVIHYKANFGEVDWFMLDFDADERYEVDPPTTYKGYLSLEWSIDTSNPLPIAVDERGIAKGLGPTQAISLYHDVTVIDEWVSSGHEYGEFDYGWFGPNQTPSSHHASAAELQEIGISFGGIVLGISGLERNGDIFIFEGESVWVTTAPVPLPAGFPAFLIALGGLAYWSRKRRRG